MKLEKIVKNIIYIYVFLIPFEHILEHFFGIDTIFKPYRTFGMIFIIFSFLYIITRNKKIVIKKIDIPLYGVYVIILLVSFFQMFFGVFSMALFLNAINQVSLYILIFFCMKNFDWTFKEIIKILISVSIGITINNIYTIYTLVEIGSLAALLTRSPGFMDNSNGFALANCIVIIVCIFGMLKLKNRIYPILIFPFLLLSLVCIPLSGSRTAVLIIGMIFLMVFLFYFNFRSKLITIGVTGLILISVFSSSQMSMLFYSTSIVERATNVEHTGGFQRDVRLYIWEAGISAGKDYSFMGLGLAQFLNYDNFKKYMLDINPFLANRGTGLGLHNDYLNVLIEGGGVAFIMFIFFWGKVFLQTLLRNLRKKVHKNDKILSQIQLLLFFSLSLFGCFTVTQLSPLNWLMKGLITIIPNDSDY